MFSCTKILSFRNIVTLHTKKIIGTLSLSILILPNSNSFPLIQISQGRNGLKIHFRTLTKTGRNQKKNFRGERGPLPPNFCNDSTEKGVGVLSPPNIWSHDRQQLRGKCQRMPAHAGLCRRTAFAGVRRRTAFAGVCQRKKMLNRRKTRKRITTHNNRQSINSSTGRSSHKYQR